MRIVRVLGSGFGFQGLRSGVWSLRLGVYSPHQRLCLGIISSTLSTMVRYTMEPKVTLGNYPHLDIEDLGLGNLGYRNYTLEFRI